MDSGDPGGDRRAFRLDEQRPYWPGGVKLDSEIRFDNDGAPARHVITWVLTWDDVSAFFPRDYYAHDLYMDKSNGTFLEPSAIDIFSSLPLVQRYRFDDGHNLLRYGWASYRPAEIQAGVTYTVVIQSPPGSTPIDDFAEDIETYGVRIPGTCIRNCVWVPTSWCSVALGGNSIRLFNNSNPAGLVPLGVPQGGCNRLFYLPSIFSP